VDLCVMIEGQEGVTWPQWQAIAAACEEHGIPALFRSDHYLPLQGGEKPVLDTWATVNALAATTSTLRLGTLVSPTTFRHPAVLAKTALTADHISGGRVELGIGAGWHEGEHEAFGFAFGTVGSRMDVFAEQLRIVREHLDGRFLPGPTGSLPIIVGGRAKPRTVALAAQYADEYNTVFATPDECRERRAVLGDDTPHPAWVSGTLDEAASHLRELREAGVDRVMLQLLLHEDLEQIELIGALA
jgi:alkanesulfonate monooxygenase SsuD/methylene tetrahydromethanopterin reductase-like flavin-dependent oxidoreductase (luciferase family)